MQTVAMEAGKKLVEIANKMPFGSQRSLVLNKNENVVIQSLEQETCR
jgi:hypothetical protein